VTKRSAERRVTSGARALLRSGRLRLRKEYLYRDWQ
jgi:hypothetical protein